MKWSSAPASILPVLLPALLPVLVLGGCSGAEDDEPPAGSPGVPAARPFAAGTNAVPDGFHRVGCTDLRPDGTGLRAEVVVPDDLARASKGPSSCAFRTGFRHALTIDLAPEETLADWNKKYVAPYEAEGGDDATSDISYEGSVPAFGGLDGERLTWSAFNDGLPEREVAYQAGGIRLVWTRPQGASAGAADLRHVLGGLGVVRSPRVDDCTVRRGDVVVTYRPPEATESIEDYDGTCRMLHTTHGWQLTLATVTPEPRSPLARMAGRLRERAHVTGLRFAAGAASVGAEPADLLTWVVVRRHDTGHGPAGSWRTTVAQGAGVRVTWLASLAEWRDGGADAFNRLARSVRRGPS